MSASTLPAGVTHISASDICGEKYISSRTALCVYSSTARSSVARGTKRRRKIKAIETVALLYDNLLRAVKAWRTHRCSATYILLERSYSQRREKRWRREA